MLGGGWNGGDGGCYDGEVNSTCNTDVTMRKTKPKSKTKRKRKLGDCYEYAFDSIVGNPGQKSRLEVWLDENYALPASRREIFLVHGMVTGEVGRVKGRRYGHAWCEVRVDKKWFAVDCGTSVQLFRLFPRRLYYSAGQIKASECQRYEVVEACKRAVACNHYGPWDDLGDVNK